MFIRKGQKIKVKTIEDFKNTPMVIVTPLEVTSLFDKKSCNNYMLSIKEITAKHNCYSNNIEAEEGWYWSEWMLEFPHSNNPIE